MWKINSNQAYLDISKIKNNFRIYSSSGYTLVCPKKNYWDWEDEERWLRSIMVNKDGRVVSCGWPKFGNYNEFTNDTNILNDNIHKALFTHKHDGSLAIRSVVDNKVIFRTRGTLFGGDYDENGNEPFGVKFNRVAKKYQKLLDINWCADRSLLFEYVSPNNKIVVKYDEEDLIFIGFVYHNLTIGSWGETKLIAKEGNLKLVEVYELPKDPKKILKIIKDWDDEGIVVRCGQTMVKIKSASYLYKHRIKSNMNYKFMVDYIQISGIDTEKDLIKELSADLDYEVVMEGIKFFRQYQYALRQYNYYYNKSLELFNSFHYDGEPIEKRKQFAKIACQQNSYVKILMFALFSNKQEVFNKVKNRIIKEG